MAEFHAQSESSFEIPSEFLFIGEAEAPFDAETQEFNHALNTVLSRARVIGAVNQSVIPGREITLPYLKDRLGEIKKHIPVPAEADRLYNIVKRVEMTRKTVISHFRVAAGLKRSKRPVSEWPDGENEAVARTIFRLTTGEEPVGDVRLLMSPLAVSIALPNHDDLKKFGMTDNDGGFCDPRMEITDQYKKAYPELSSMPFILIAVEDPETQLNHELGHAVVQTVREAWMSNKRDTFGEWAKSDWSHDIVRQELRNFNKYVMHWAKSHFSLEYKQLKKQGKWSSERALSLWIANGGQQEADEFGKFLVRRILPRALGNAKEEIIVGFKQRGDMSYLWSVNKPDGSYNILRTFVAIALQNRQFQTLNPLIQMVNERYSNIFRAYDESLQKWVHALVDVQYAYRKAGLQEREAMFGEIMMQVPLAITGKKSVADSAADVSQSVHAMFDREIEALDPFIKTRDALYELDLMQKRADGDVVQLFEITKSYRIAADRMLKDNRLRRRLRELEQEGNMLYDSVYARLRDNQNESLILQMYIYDTQLRGWLKKVNTAISGTESKVKHKRS